MINEKNIDQMLGDIDGFLNINEESVPIDIEKVALEHKEKKLREIKGNSYHLKALFFVVIALFGLNPVLENFINIFIVTIAVGSMLWLQGKAKKEMAQIDLALTFNEYQNQRRSLAESTFKLFKGIRIVIYSMLTVLAGLNIFYFLRDPDLLSFVVYFTTTCIGIFISVRAMERAIKEYRNIAQN